MKYKVSLSYMRKKVSVSFGNLKATFAKFIDHGKKLHSMMHNEMQLALIGLLKRRCLIKEDILIKKMITCNGGFT